MSIREELIKAIKAMKEEELVAVWEYVRLLQEPEEAEPTEEERRALARGREEYGRGEYVKWNDIRRSAKA